MMTCEVTKRLPRPRVRARGTRSARPVRRHAVSLRPSAFLLDGPRRIAAQGRCLCSRRISGGRPGAHI